MRVGRFPLLASLSLLQLVLPLFAFGADWPQWGGTLSRNMVSAETGLPNYFSVGVPGRGDTWVTKPENLKWAARLGSPASRSCGRPSPGGAGTRRST